MPHRSASSVRWTIRCFPLSEKIEVNGDGADPLWRWLAREKRGVLGSARIKWNFSKFLVDRQGRVVSRHAPTTRPEQLRGEIDAYVSEWNVTT